MLANKKVDFLCLSQDLLSQSIAIFVSAPEINEVRFLEVRTPKKFKI